jgi:hypothetical protein
LLHHHCLILGLPSSSPFASLPTHLLCLTVPPLPGLMKQTRSKGPLLSLPEPLHFTNTSSPLAGSRQRTAWGHLHPGTGQGLGSGRGRNGPKVHSAAGKAWPWLAFPQQCKSAQCLIHTYGTMEETEDGRGCGQEGAAWRARSLHHHPASLLEPSGLDRAGPRYRAAGSESSCEGGAQGSPRGWLYPPHRNRGIHPRPAYEHGL